jgi:hypothetical protein
MYDIITKEKYFNCLDEDLVDVKNSSLKNIQDAFILSQIYTRDSQNDINLVLANRQSLKPRIVSLCRITCMSLQQGQRREEGTFFIEKTTFPSSKRERTYWQPRMPKP